MDVSVIIPSYDRGATLERSLGSVLAQRTPSREIIVVDDGSTDGTGDWVRTRFPQVRYIRQDNQGVSSARNRGIRAARAEWLAFLDSDDQWLPEKLALQQQALQANPHLRVCHTHEIWMRAGRRVNPCKHHKKHGGFIFQHCLPRCVISPSSVIVHRSVFEQVGLFDESLPACEDYELWLRVCARLPVLYVERPLIIKYGGHADQLSRRYPAMDRFRIQALERIVGSGALSAADRAAALAMLLEKIEIYLKGATRRGRLPEVARYRRLHARYARLAAGSNKGVSNPSLLEERA